MSFSPNFKSLIPALIVKFFSKMVSRVGSNSSSTDSNKKLPDSNGINLQNLNFLLTKRFNLKKTSNQS